ncbi:porin [Alicycliphilus denitrificans]|uniref:porin n=1 Tax=Alicycliphilus denitrificans TaxID=179636 RepID=UPI0009643754|nr:porin [Alicycliphilus denitrificans]MBN9574536.1 porin [Alicycliphilus denitrificans]OJW89269.1 MAG: porin [Alicycliphilus sp. 69-12]BCN40512.1 porin [Alicycliphilus denitrificans]
MRKPIALAIAGLAGLAGLALSPAHAQSSVTLYGIVDTGVTRIDDAGAGGGNTLLRSGNLLTSRFGFRGTEDLGGGLKALFNLEAGLNVDTGATSTPYFNRQSWVGLSSESFGNVWMGRMLPIISDIFISSQQAPYLGNTAAAIDGAAIGAGSSVARFNNMTQTRVDNAIKYQGPSLAGFKVHAMTALGEVAGSSSAGRILSLGGSYNSESIEAGLAYHEKQCTDAGGCAAGKDKDKIFGVGGSYKFNGNRIGVVYTSQKNALNVAGNDADVFDLLVRVPMGQVVLGAGYQYLNDKTSLNQDTSQVNLAATYVLSKRTQLYALYSHQSVKNGGKAGMYSVTSSKDKQNQFSAGIVHMF